MEVGTTFQQAALWSPESGRKLTIINITIVANILSLPSNFLPINLNRWSYESQERYGYPFCWRHCWPLWFRHSQSLYHGWRPTIPSLDDMFSPLSMNSRSAMSISSPTAALADNLSKIGSDDNESPYYQPSSYTTTDIGSKTIEIPQHLRGVPLAK